MTAGRPFPEVDSQRFVLVPVKDRGVFGLWAFVTLGLLGGLLLWFVMSLDSGSSTPAALPSNAPSSGQSDPAWATMAAIEVTRLATETAPTPTSTATATPVPTATQMVVWQPEPCSTPEPGKLCRVPDRMPPTPTPYPSCYEMPEPGKWCRWEIADDAPDGRTETR